MADMESATREDDYDDRIEPEREMGRSGASPWGVLLELIGLNGEKTC